MKVAVIVGSLRKESLNLKLAKAMAAMAPEGVEFDFVRIDDLPLYSQEFDDNYPAEALRLKDQIASADALLFFTPEYNRSIPGVLKNAIDWGSRPWGKSVWGGKAAGVLGVSIGAIGTALAQQHLRSVLAYLDVVILGQPEVYLHAKEGFFNADGSIANEDTKAFLRKYLTRYVDFVKNNKD